VWARPAGRADAAGEAEDTEFADPPAPLIDAPVIGAAVRAVAAAGLPARLSTLIDACHRDTAEPSPAVRRRAAEVLCLAVLWAYAPEEADDGGLGDDLVARILGPRAAVDSDGVRLPAPHWDGDDVIVAPDADALADADPPPTALDTAGPAAACAPVPQR
jgi:hypothetical protein